MSLTVSRVGASTKVTDDDARGGVEPGAKHDSTARGEPTRRPPGRGRDRRRRRLGLGGDRERTGAREGSGRVSRRRLPAEGNHRIRPERRPRERLGQDVHDADAVGQTGDPEAFGNTRIQGFIRVGDAEAPRLAFVEPMVTREFLRWFDGKGTYEIP